LFLIPVFLCSVFGNTKTHDYKKEVKTYLRGLKYLSSDFVQTNSEGAVYSGHIYIAKEKTKKVRVDYEESIRQKIVIKGDIITITDLDSKEKTQHSVKQTPIYDVLSDNIELDERNCSVNNLGTEYIEVVICEIVPSGKVYVSLIFSRYSNGNVKNLEGWVIKEANDQKTEVSFFPDSLSVNDKSKIPNAVFEE
jgi:outer membrane lipoprotein-sorting protein